MTSVRSRILLFFTLFALAAFTAVFMSSRSLQIIGEAANAISSRHLPLVQAFGDMEVALERQGNAVYRYLVTGDKAWRDDCEKERLNYNRAFSETQRWISEPIEQDKLNEIDELYVQYDNQTRQIMMTPRNSINSNRMLKEANQSLEKIRTFIDQLQGMRQGMSMVRKDQINDTLSRHQRGAYYFLATIAIFFFLLAFYLWRFLVQPLTFLLEGIRNFTRGKIDVQMPSIGKDELGELQEAFNEMSRELTAERKRLRSESQSDSLTGLFNMRYFRMQLAEEFTRSQRYGRPLTLLMLDVDYFKAYNDKNGHPAGDIVLKEVSRILIRNVRGTDIVARYGGEEFVVLLPETPVESGINVAEKIRKAVEDHHFPFGGVLNSRDNLTLSVGVASYPHPQITSDQELIESADKALYTSKKNGRNQVVLFGKTESASTPLFPSSPTKKSAVIPPRVVQRGG